MPWCFSIVLEKQCSTSGAGCFLSIGPSMTEKKEKKKGGNNAMNHDLHDEVHDKWNVMRQNVQNPGYILCAG